MISNFIKRISQVEWKQSFLIKTSIELSWVACMGIASTTDNILNTINQKSHRKCHNTLVKMYIQYESNRHDICIDLHPILHHRRFHNSNRKWREFFFCMLRRQCTSLNFSLAFHWLHPIYSTLYMHACEWIQLNLM